jgi:hypothetical protein
MSAILGVDARVCGGVGIRYRTGRCRVYDDCSAAIWVSTADG